MRHKDRVNIFLSRLFCLFAVACAAVVATVLLVPSATIRIRYFLLCFAGAFLFPSAAALLRSFTDVNEKARKSLIRGVVLFVFFFYLIVFLSTILFAKVLGNHVGFSFEYNKFWLEEALPRLIPFSSLTKVFKGFALGRVSALSLCINVMGNFFLYTPLAFFVPALSKSARTFDSFLPFMVFLILAVELAQGMFGLGSFETDDIILGLSGALVAYAVLNYGPVGNFFRENYFYF